MSENTKTNFYFVNSEGMRVMPYVTTMGDLKYNNGSHVFEYLSDANAWIRIQKEAALVLGRSLTEINVWLSKLEIIQEKIITSVIHIPVKKFEE